MRSQAELTAAVLISNSELRFAGATRGRREFMFGECQALFFRTEGARQANPGQARGASAALGVNGPPTFCTLKACGRAPFGRQRGRTLSACDEFYGRASEPRPLAWASLPQPFGLKSWVVEISQRVRFQFRPGNQGFSPGNRTLAARIYLGATTSLFSKTFQFRRLRKSARPS